MAAVSGVSSLLLRHDARAIKGLDYVNTLGFWGQTLESADCRAGAVVAPKQQPDSVDAQQQGSRSQPRRSGSASATRLPTCVSRSSSGVNVIPNMEPKGHPVLTLAPAEPLLADAGKAAVPKSAIHPVSAIGDDVRGRVGVAALDLDLHRAGEATSPVRNSKSPVASAQNGFASQPRIAAIDFASRRAGRKKQRQENNGENSQQTHGLGHWHGRLVNRRRTKVEGGSWPKPDHAIGRSRSFQPKITDQLAKVGPGRVLEESDLDRIPWASARTVQDVEASTTGDDRTGWRRISQPITPPSASTAACSTMAGQSDRVASTIAVKTRPIAPVRITPSRPW